MCNAFIWVPAFIFLLVWIVRPKHHRWALYVALGMIAADLLTWLGAVFAMWSISGGSRY